MTLGAYSDYWELSYTGEKLEMYRTSKLECVIFSDHVFYWKDMHTTMKLDITLILFYITLTDEIGNEKYSKHVFIIVGKLLLLPFFQE